MGADKGILRNLLGVLPITKQREDLGEDSPLVTKDQLIVRPEVAIAGALKADRLLLLTDVPGVKDASGEIVTQLTPEQVKEMIADGTISGGMIPKTETALKAIEDGVRAVVILDGRLPNAALLELFTEHGAGSIIRSTEPRVKPKHK